MEIYYNKAAKHQMKQQIRYQRGKKVMQWCSLNYWVIGEIFPVCIRMRAWWADVRQYSWKLFGSCMYMFWRIDLFCWLFFVFHQCMDALDRKERLHISIWSLCFIRSWWINFTCHCFDYACRSDWRECGKCCLVWPD